MTDHLKQSVSDYLADAAAGKPTPGGGSVAALAGALGASMASMAANFTVGKPDFAAVETEVRELLGKLSHAGDKLRLLVQKDTEVYAAFGKAAKLPRKTPAEKASRQAAMAEASRNAMAVPLEAVRACAEALAAAERLADVANPRLISDVGVAAILLEAAARAAALNVMVNLPHVGDSASAAEASSELGRLLPECAALSRSACGIVEDALSRGVEG